MNKELVEDYVHSLDIERNRVNNGVEDSIDSLHKERISGR
jgi:hypothetical protein